MTRAAKVPHPALRALALLLFFAMLTSAAAAPASDRKKADEEAAERQRTGLSKPVAERLLQAYELLQTDQFDASLAIVEELAKRKKLTPPEIAQIHRFRGYIFVNKDLMDRAAAEFEQSLAQNALDKTAEQVMTYSLAQIYTQLGNYDRALELIDAWFQSEESPTPDAYYLKAMILVQQEKFQAAVEPARTAIDMSPNPRESWLQLLAAIHSELKDYPSLAATLERLVVLAPGKKQYWVQLAAVLNYLERDDRALATLRVAEEAELLSEDRELRQLARLFFLREQPFQCAQVMDQGIAAGVVKADAEAYRLMSNCYIAAREAERALEPLAKAGELAPDGEMYMLLGQMHLQRERFQPALEVLHKALAKSKPEQRGSVNLLIGVAELGVERFDAAERAFHAAQADARVRRAAESYLKYVKEQRARREQRQQAGTPSKG
jgi:tetratricopeptide (TPR) repeat protein